MKLVSVESSTHSNNVAILHDNKVYILNQVDSSMPTGMTELLEGGEDLMDKAKSLNEEIKKGEFSEKAEDLGNLKLLSPIPHPSSTRDAYAFRQHVRTARRNRGVDMIPEFDQFPVFYFTNHNVTFGPGKIELMPDHFKKLDFELEIAIVVGKKGRNIKASEGHQYIAGYMIMNDISARQLQMEEMKLNLGPAKGKDFGNSFGPYMVTPDELEELKVDAKEGHTGVQYRLGMRAYHNGKQISEGNFADMDWSFGEILERVSYGVDVNPGDVIGSGTVGTGCFLELNGTAKLENPDHEPVWIKPGDTIKLEIDGLGELENTFEMADTNYSLLALKKNV